MNKFYDTLTNTRGDVLPNYRAQVVNPNGTLVDIFADRSGTPFTDANGGTVNYATADSEGLVQFYWEAATGQIFQMLDPAGDLVKVVEGFADNYVIDNFSGSLTIDRVVDLGDELLALNEGVAAAATTAALASPEPGKGADMVVRLSGITVEQSLEEIPSITDHGAVTYATKELALAGTDSTAAINSALATGMPHRVPAGYFKYSGNLICDAAGGGLLGLGSRRSFLVTDTSLDRHLAVIEGTQGTQWVGFTVIGPGIYDGNDANRALTVGLKSDLTGPASGNWDASGTWIDDVRTIDCCTGFQFAGSDDAQFGDIETYETGDSRDEPGAYGIVCSGSRVRGRSLRSVNTATRGRHAVYLVGNSNNCFIDYIYGKGFDLAAFQNRVASEGGGNGNGYGSADFEDCNTGNITTGPQAVVNFLTAGDVVIATAGNARIGDTTVKDCGGIGVALRYFPNSRAGKLTIDGHTGEWGSVNRFLAHVFNSPGTTVPQVDVKSGTVNDNTAIALRVESSDKCRGFSALRVAGSNTYECGLEIITSNNCRLAGVDTAGTYSFPVRFQSATGNKVSDIEADGTYTHAVRFGGSADRNQAVDVIPLTAPTTAFYSDGSTGNRHNLAMRAPGYDVLEITSGGTVNVAGYRTVRSNLVSGANVNRYSGIQQGQQVTTVAINSNATFVHDSTGDGPFLLAGAANLTLTAGQSFVVSGHVTGTGGSVVVKSVQPL